jgi:hypothetical protein
MATAIQAERLQDLAFKPSQGRNFSVCHYVQISGRDSSVGIATRYELDGPGTESRWRQNFPHLS